MQQRYVKVFGNHYLNGKLRRSAMLCSSLQPETRCLHCHSPRRMKANYFRVSRLVVLPDYQGIGLGKRLLNFIAEHYTSQITLPFYLFTSNPQLVRGNEGNWRVKRVGHGTAESEDTRINSEPTKSNSKRRLSLTLQYIPKLKSGGS